jgi:hypothetical protein
MFRRSIERSNAHAFAEETEVSAPALRAIQ